VRRSALWCHETEQTVGVGESFPTSIVVRHLSHHWARIASSRSRTTWSRPFDEEVASRSDNVGEYVRTVSASTLCQTGSITFCPATSLATNPSSSFWGHSLWRKLWLMTTMPYRDRERPRSIDRLRLSPTVRVKSSYHTLGLCLEEPVLDRKRRTPCLPTREK